MKLCYKPVFYCMSLIVTAWGMASCSEMDDTYDDFLEGGEIIYVQGADSLRVHPGYNRVKLSWLALSDPSVTRAVIYWNNRHDSLEVPIEKTENVDTLSVLIENLEERIYTFEVYTYDDKGHTSVPTLGIGESFGDDYNSSLIPRLVSFALFANDTLEIIWSSGDTTAIAAEIQYTDTMGNSRLTYLPTGQSGPDTTLIADYDHLAEGKFRFRSVYLPHPLCIDTFYTGYQDVKVIGPPAPYDRTGWTATASSYDDRDGRVDRLPGIALDGDVSSIWVNQISPQQQYPHWIAVDMGGVKTGIAGIWLGFQDARDEIPRSIDISISDDGLNWTVLGRYEVKNEGGTQYFDLPEPLDFRYFRVDCLEPSGDNPNVVIGEIGAYSR